MEEQKRKSKESGAFKLDYTQQLTLEGATDFLGYEHLEAQGTITSLIKDGKTVTEINEGDEAAIVLDSTPFYGESGGQVGDAGYISHGKTKFEVQDCQKNGNNHLHIGRLLHGSLKVGEKVTATVDSSVRQATALNHSATHLLHAALREVLGAHVTQKGSLVDSERLRFDFSHFEAVTPEELQRIEKRVNDQILKNSAVQTELCDMESAKKKGAMMLFGEKYGDEVRVLTMGDGFSVELCGGTHVKRTGDIGLMRIVSESGIAAGVRRIEAITGHKALQLFDETCTTLNDAAKQLKTTTEKLPEKLAQLLAHNRQLEKELNALKAKLAASSVNDWLAEAEEIKGVKVLAKILDGADAKSLRDTVDQLKNKLGTSAVLLAAVNGEKISLAAGVSADAVSKIKAGDIVKHVAEQIGGKGGGRPDMAQGGGTDVAALPAAMKSLNTWAATVIV